MKTCVDCGKSIPYKKQSPAVYCRECSANKQKAARQKWLEEHPEYHAQWRKENPDYHKEWAERHPTYYHNQYVRRKIEHVRKTLQDL